MLYGTFDRSGHSVGVLSISLSVFSEPDRRHLCEGVGGAVHHLQEKDGGAGNGGADSGVVTI